MGSLLARENRKSKSFLLQAQRDLGAQEQCQCDSVSPLSLLSCPVLTLVLGELSPVDDRDGPESLSSSIIS